MRNAKLAGRVAVRFVLAPAGTVLASAIAESSLTNAHVETCVAQAVKRWQFPAAPQAGTKVVTYPFAFSPAGG